MFQLFSCAAGGGELETALVTLILGLDAECIELVNHYRACNIMAADLEILHEVFRSPANSDSFQIWIPFDSCELTARTNWRSVLTLGPAVRRTGQRVQMRVSKLRTRCPSQPSALISRIWLIRRDRF